MNISSSLMLVAVISFSLLLSGCGSSTEVENVAHNTTMGQELMDIEESYRKGIITEKEYEKAKESILKRYK